MKDSNSPQAPVQLNNQEGSGLLDVKQMAEALKSTENSKKQRNLLDMSLPMAPAAPLTGALLLPLPKQRSPLALIGIIMGGTVAATAVLFGTLFAAGVFDKKAPPAPIQSAVAAPPTVVAPAPAPVVEQPVAEAAPADPKAKTGTKTKGTKTTAAAKTTGNTTAAPANNPPPPPKKKSHSDELEDLLGGK